MMGPMTPAQIRDVLKEHLAAKGEDPVRVLDQLARQYADKEGGSTPEIIESLKRVLKGPRKRRTRKKTVKA